MYNNIDLMKSFLIIGGASLVGSTLSSYIPKENIHVTYNNEIPENTSPMTKVSLLDDRDKINKLIKKINPDIVINTVALPSVDKCEEEHEIADLLHKKIVEEITQTCNEINSKFVHFSTDAVFDGKLNRKYTLEDKPNPVNYYGKTRLDAEKIVMKISSNNVVLRTSVIYGWHKRSRFSNWIIDSLKQNIIVDPHVDQFNTPTLVDDLAKMIVRITEKDLSGIYHATGKTCVSRYEFAKMLARGFKLNENLIKPVTSNEKKQGAPRPPKTCLDSTKLEMDSGLEFSTLEQGIKFIFNKQNNI